MVNDKMRDLDDIIRYEGEGTYVDFKKIPYLPYNEKKKTDLIKDIMSLANADVEGDRYIIIGVSFGDKKNRSLDGVSPSDIPDPAIYQQLIHENIFPDIQFDVLCHTVDGIIFGIIKIESCKNGPYEMRKEFGSLKKGERWIRKGTIQTPLLRADLDRIYSERYNRSKFVGEIKISFDEYGHQEAVFPAIGSYSKPSDYYKRRIEKALDRKRNPPPPKTPVSMAGVLASSFSSANALYSFSNPFDYDRYSIAELEEKLETVHEDHEEANLYDLYEEHGQRLSLIIENNSNQYIEDTRITLEMPRNGIRVAEQVYDEPSHGMLLPGLSPDAIRSRVNNYAIVKYTESSIKIIRKIGDVPHLLPTAVFNIRPRIVFSNELIGTTIEAKCTIHARNLETQFVQSLTIRIAEPVPDEVDSVEKAAGE